MNFEMNFVWLICFFLTTAPTVVLLGKETDGRVPLTDQLFVKDLRDILDSLETHYYKGREWQALCLALGLTDVTIGVIEMNHNQNVERCLKECLSSWLRKEDLVNEPNWETLISALKSIGENAAAEEIDKKKQPACIIFNKFHDEILSSIRGYPEDIAILLHKEEVISHAVLEKVETHRGMGTGILLDEVHKVIYKNYKNVQKLAVILKKFTDTELVGKFILEEYGKTFPDEETESVEVSGGIKIRIPRNYESKFKELRSFWWTTILDVVNLIKFPAAQEQLRDYLFGNSKLVVEKPGKESLLKFLKEECSLIDITHLERIADYLEIKEAKPIIKQYKIRRNEFRDNVSLHFSLNETIYKYPVLKGEKIVIEVNREVEDKTLKDIDDLFHIAFEEFFFSVKLVAIRESNSFIIICSFPLILTELLISTVVKNIELLKEEGVQQLIIGYVNVYSHNEIHDTESSINISGLIRKSQLHMGQYLKGKEEENVELSQSDDNTWLNWLSSLMLICITILIIILTTIVMKTWINKGTKTQLLKGLQQIQKEHAQSFNEELPSTDNANTTFDVTIDTSCAENLVQEDQSDERREPIKNATETRPYEQQIIESFKVFVLQPPTLDELVRYIDLGDKWYLVGTLLGINQKKLDAIDVSSSKKSTEVYKLWLSSNKANRKLILEVLKNEIIGDDIEFEGYETYLKKTHNSIYVQNLDLAVEIFELHMQSLNEVPFSLICISQVLYSRGCISEAILDQTETVDDQITLHDKKTILLAGMQETVSSDYRKLKLIATVLSEFEELKVIANEIKNEYDQKIHDRSNIPINDAQNTDNEDYVCNILRKYYSSLSKSLSEPINVAKMLYSNEMISDEVLANVVSNRRNIFDCRAILLKAVRHLVHSNHENIQPLLTVLESFSEIAEVANNIRDECAHGQYDIVMTNQNCSEETTERSETESALGLPQQNSYEHSFMLLNAYSHDFSIVRRNFTAMIISLHEELELIVLTNLKKYIKYGYPHLFHQLHNCQHTSDAVDVICQQCSLTDISLLEGVVCHFKLKRAILLINEYQEFLQGHLKGIYNRHFSRFCDRMPDNVDTLNIAVSQSIDYYTFIDIKMIAEAALMQNVPVKNFKKIIFFQQ